MKIPQRKMFIPLKFWYLLIRFIIVQLKNKIMNFKVGFKLAQLNIRSDASSHIKKVSEQDGQKDRVYFYGYRVLWLYLLQNNVKLFVKKLQKLLQEVPHLKLMYSTL